MGQRGPRPKPAAMKLLANPGKRPVANVQHSQVTAGAPDRPAVLMGEAAAEWDRLVPDLDAAGRLALVDRGVLVAYCLAWADMVAAAEAINEHGRWQSVDVQTSRGDVVGSKLVEHPAVKLLVTASARVQKLGAELGITPASRLRLDGSPGVETPQGNAVLDLRERIAAIRGAEG